MPLFDSPVELAFLPDQCLGIQPHGDAAGGLRVASCEAYVEPHPDGANLQRVEARPGSSVVDHALYAAYVALRSGIVTVVAFNNVVTTIRPSVADDLALGLDTATTEAILARFNTITTAEPLSADDKLRIGATALRVVLALP